MIGGTAAAALLVATPAQTAPEPPPAPIAAAIPTPQAASTPQDTATPATPPAVPAELADPLADPASAAATPSPVEAMDRPAPPEVKDPLEGFNRRMFRAHERFDRHVFGPAARGYRHVVPRPVRSGLRNFFSNLGEPIVFLNYLLQLKPGKAAETLGRFIINTGLGVGGLIDVARAPGVKLPHRSNGLGNTLALYGVKPGPYLFLPFVGPTTLRDLAGGQADGLVLPLAVGSPFDRFEYQVAHGAITGLDRRAEADAELKALFAGAVDPYATLRSVYLQNRQGEIDQLRGHPRRPAAAVPQLGEPLADPAGTGPKPGDATELDDPLIDPAAKPAAPAPK